jgi:hypothetical protein
VWNIDFSSNVLVNADPATACLQLRMSIVADDSLKWVTLNTSVDKGSVSNKQRGQTGRAHGVRW